MAPTKDWTLHRPDNAPILNPYITYIEKVLKALEDGLGDKNASTLNAGKLAKKAAERPGESALRQQYDLNMKQVEGYQNDWESLDDQIGFIAGFAAEDANTVSREFEDLRDSAVEITAAVPDDPSPVRQLDAVNALDNAVGVAYEAILRANAKLVGKSAEVPAQNWSSNGGAAPYVPGITDTSTAYSGVSAQPIGEGVMAKLEDLYKYLLEKGFSPAQAAGILGNFQVEAPGFNTGAYNPGEAAIGLAQWQGGRRANLEAFAAAQGKSVTDWKTQIDFMVHEMRGTPGISGMGARSESAAYNSLMGAGSASAAAQVFDGEYERSSGDARGQRVANAESIAISMRNVKASTDSSVLA
ncbi:phage tail tip lysozyme [Nocardia sienata]|uniref:phage tail tip lysozyme n=1 Tax=Nocardia sienata TaxID=248552 RepID=UPI0007A4B444|nr:phage tail tip lysozyme [Nocardia sienata]